MKISVIVPVYNCADYVERCVRSIMDQTYNKLEIICVDDGSIDGSGRILDSLAAEDSRMRVIHQANGGASAARNAGIDYATGELITFVDSDDAIEADMYETLLPLFTNESVDIVHCGYKRIRPDGTVKEVNGTGCVVNQSRYEASECLLLGTLFVGSVCNKLYRAHLFKNVRLDTALAINEDVLANAELFSRAKDTVFWDVGKYLMYERPGSATSGTKQHKVLTDCANAAEKMLRIFINTPAEAAAEKRCVHSKISLYRWYVMHSMKDNREAMRQLANSLDAAMRQRTGISPRQRMNYRLMRYFPKLYKYAYRIYDKIRIPDWDVQPD